MKYDEFAFFNQQLAGMLKSGIPLEGALRQLSSTMRRGKLRQELSALEQELQQGVPFEKAIANRNLPPSYVQMLRVGAGSCDLPGTLTLVADHYQQLSLIFTRLSGLMVYPIIILSASFGLSVLLAFLQRWIIREVDLQIPIPFYATVVPLLPPLTILLLLGFATVLLLNSRLRTKVAWRIPAARDAYLARLASTGEMMLRRGLTLPETLTSLSQLESANRVGSELKQWHDSLAQGKSEFPNSSHFPPLFIWVLKSAGEDLAEGFRRAGEIYRRRAQHKIDMLLFAALPIAVIILAAMIALQVFPVIKHMLRLMDGGFAG